MQIDVKKLGMLKANDPVERKKRDRSAAPVRTSVDHLARDGAQVLATIQAHDGTGRPRME